jgi:hypothetical protein
MEEEVYNSTKSVGKPRFAYQATCKTRRNAPKITLLREIDQTDRASETKPQTTLRNRTHWQKKKIVPRKTLHEVISYLTRTIEGRSAPRRMLQARRNAPVQPRKPADERDPGFCSSGRR